MLLTGLKQIFNPASRREHDCASHCGGAPSVTPEDHRLQLNILLADSSFDLRNNACRAQDCHRNAGAWRQAEACICFSLQSFLAPQVSCQHKAWKGKKCALTLLYPLLTPIKSKGLFFFFLKTYKKPACSLLGNEQRKSCHCLSWKIMG